MQLFSRDEFESYIKSNFELMYEESKNFESDRVSSKCDSCGRDIYLKANSYYQAPKYGILASMPDFETVYVECPNCGRRSFIQTVVFKEQIDIEIQGPPQYYYKHYLLYRIPDREIKYETSSIPKKYTTLISSINEALFCMDRSKFVSASLVFRRALQMIAKNVLGAKGKTLFNQLEWLKENANLLNIDLTELFHDNSQLIKDVGNQAAHPDDDITLQEFTKDDVNKLYDLFLIIVNEIFIKPEKIKKIQEELKEKRKLK